MDPWSESVARFAAWAGVPARRVGRWIAANPVAAFTIAGGVLYVYFRIALVLFYREFGVRPEDVGLGYTQTLVQVATASAMWILLGVLVVLVFVLMGAVKKSYVATPPGFLAVFVVSQVITISLVLLFSGRQNAHLVRAGKATSDSALFDTLLNPLGISATCVRVTPLNEAGNKVAKVLLVGRVLYLGKADGVGVFFRPDTDTTVLTPLEGVALQTTETNDQRCRAAQ